MEVIQSNFGIRIAKINITSHFVKVMNNKLQIALEAEDLLIHSTNIGIGPAGSEKMITGFATDDLETWTEDKLVDAAVIKKVIENQNANGSVDLSDSKTDTDAKLGKKTGITKENITVTSELISEHECQLQFNVEPTFNGGNISQRILFQDSGSLILTVTVYFNSNGSIGYGSDGNTYLGNDFTLEYDKETMTITMKNIKSSIAQLWGPPEINMGSKSYCDEIELDEYYTKTQVNELIQPLLARIVALESKISQ